MQVLPPPVAFDFVAPLSVRALPGVGSKLQAELAKVSVGRWGKAKSEEVRREEEWRMMIWGMHACVVDDGHVGRGVEDDDMGYAC